MDRAFEVSAPPDVVWPWLVQLGKARAGWYLPERGSTSSLAADGPFDVSTRGGST